MKNYFMGSIAILLAIAFSAFTTIHKSSDSLDDLYWYPVDGTVTSGPSVFHGSEAGAKTMDCPDATNQPVCLFGDESSSLPTNTPIGSDEARLIREKN